MAPRDSWRGHRLELGLDNLMLVFMVDSRHVSGISINNRTLQRDPGVSGQAGPTYSCPVWRCLFAYGIGIGCCLDCIMVVIKDATTCILYWGTVEVIGSIRVTIVERGMTFEIAG